MKTTASQNSRHRRGAISVEYLLVLALVVIPLAIMADSVIFYPWTATNSQATQINNGTANPNNHPTLIYSYFDRISTMIRVPFG
jgi:hypothetical protein